MFNEKFKKKKKQILLDKFTIIPRKFICVKWLERFFEYKNRTFIILEKVMLDFMILCLQILFSDIARRLIKVVVPTYLKDKLKA
jgi:hypothetical protein